MCEGFSKGPERFPQPKPCAKTSRGEPSNNKMDPVAKTRLAFQDLPRSWQREFNHNVLVVRSITALQ